MNDISRPQSRDVVCNVSTWLAEERIIPFAECYYLLD